MDKTSNSDHNFPTARFDDEDRFENMGALTSLSVVAARSLGKAHNAIMDSDLSEPAKAVSRVALGAFSITAVTALSLIETVSKIALAIFVGFSVWAVSMGEILFKLTAELAVKTAFSAVFLVAFPVLKSLGLVFFEAEGIADTLGSVWGDLELFDFPLVDNERGELPGHFFSSAIINGMSLNLGVSMGYQMITHHKNLQFRDFTWQDSMDNPFSLHNMIFSS
jgi:hypothetical protein